jgi:translation elongation factor EF-G
MITMKASSVSLIHNHRKPIGKDEKGKLIFDSTFYLVNLMDSPGHVDFSNEVSCSLRMSEGALIVIDVIEGVSP